MSINQAVNEWKRISARIKPLWQMWMQVSAITILHKEIYCEANQIFTLLCNFQEKFAITLTENALTCLTNFIKEKKQFFTYDASSRGPYKDVNDKCLASFILLENELSYLLSDSQTLRKKNVEISFLQLKALMIVDERMRDLWKEGWSKDKPEEHFEKLGRTHFLGNKIWTIKANGVRSETDALMLELSLDSEEIQKNFDSAVLTEWKQVRTRDKNDHSKKIKYQDKLDKQIDDAIEQLKKYADTTLAAITLSKYRYVVVVSHDALEMPENKEEDNITYRMVNIVTSPTTATGGKID